MADRQIVWITGASSGIGAVMSKVFADSGAVVVMSARNIEKLRTLGDQMSGSIDMLELDVTDSAQVDQVSNKILDQYGKVDVLINNAGFGQFKPLLQTEITDISAMMDVNFMGMVRCTKAVLPSMIKRRTGHIVNIASLAGKIGTANSAGYTASKHAVIGFTNSLRQELRSSGIYVTSINPGPVRTPFFDKADPSGAYLRNLPEWFVIEPEKVASAVLNAVKDRKPEVNLPHIGHVGVKLSHLFPRMFDRFAAKIINRK